PAMSQKFALVENGEQIVVSVNHFKSKGSSCGVGDDDTTTGQGNCNVTRTRAAQALVSHLGENFVDVHQLIIGDLNSYAKENPITTITESGFVNLIAQFQGAQAYSYSYNGELGYLDHALASASMMDKVVDTTEWHINADEPIVLDYNVEYQSDDQQTNFYAPDQYRMSDHDPVIMTFQFDAAEESGDDEPVVVVTKKGGSLGILCLLLLPLLVARRLAIVRV
ncbi:MAG: putative extracellular nuclease, partial [Paraglaciecola sp.]